MTSLGEDGGECLASVFSQAVEDGIAFISHINESLWELGGFTSTSTISSHLCVCVLVVI